MYQTINETISVLGVYARSHFVPKKFKWKEKIFPIKEITLYSDVRDGGVKKRLYSVVSGANVYRLEFNRESEKWYILEVWVE
ncbi:MAG: hypothetical protein BroJett025_05520 [Patescibacteria group bacterium]|nr:MAG: hypothetical protein BroJett025_05520 [Patescibacteria group bacterium]